jgi:hypothetical protein
MKRLAAGVFAGSFLLPAKLTKYKRKKCDNIRA